MGTFYSIVGAILVVAFLAWQFAVEYDRIPVDRHGWKQSGPFWALTFSIPFATLFAWPLTLIGFGLFFVFKKKFGVQPQT